MFIRFYRRCFQGDVCLWVIKSCLAHSLVYYLYLIFDQTLIFPYICVSMYAWSTHVSTRWMMSDCVTLSENNWQKKCLWLQFTTYSKYHIVKFSNYVILNVWEIIENVVSNLLYIINFQIISKNKTKKMSKINELHNKILCRELELVWHFYTNIFSLSPSSYFILVFVAISVTSVMLKFFL